jgi:tape measure domain-containing protein
MLVGELVAKLRADISQFIAPVEMAKREVRSLETTTVAAGAKSEGVFKGMSVSARNYVNSMGLVGRVGLTTFGAVAAAGAAVIGIGIKIAADMEQAQIAFTTMLGSAEKAQAFMAKMRAFAEATPFEFADLVTATRRMMALGFEANETLPLLEAIGNAVAAMGGGAELIDRVTLALGQMRAKGKVTGEEMRQLSESGVFGWQQLAEAIGVTVPEAMAMVESRSISAAEGISAFMQHVQGEFGGAMEAQSKTLLGLWSTLKDRGKFILADIAQPLLESAKSIATFAIAALGAIGPVFAALSPLVPLVMKFALAWAALKIIGLISNLFQGFLAALIPINASVATTTAEFWALTGASTAASAGVSTLAKTFIMAAARLAPLVLAMEFLPKFIKEVTTSAGDIAEAFKAPTEMAEEFERQVSGFSWKGADKTVTSGIQNVQQVMKELIAAGLSEDAAQARINATWRAAAAELGGFGGGIEDHLGRQRLLVGLTEEGGKASAALQAELRAEALERLRAGSAAESQAATMARLNAAYEAQSGVIEGQQQVLKDFARMVGEEFGDLVEEGITLWEELQTALANNEGIDEAQAAWRGFVEDQVAALKDWRDEVADSLNFVKGSLDELADKEKLTANDIIKEFDKQAKAMQEYRRNWTTVSDRGGEAVEDLLSEILTMGQEGANILRVLAGANDKEFGKIVGKWNAAKGNSQDLATVIQRDLVGAIKDLVEAIRGIPGFKKTTFYADTDPAMRAINELNERIREAGGSAQVVHIGGWVVHEGGPILHGGGLVPTLHGGGATYDVHRTRYEVEAPPSFHAGGLIPTLHGRVNYAAEVRAASLFHAGGRVSTLSDGGVNVGLRTLSVQVNPAIHWRPPAFHVGGPAVHVGSPASPAVHVRSPVLHVRPLVLHAGGPVQVFHDGGRPVLSQGDSPVVHVSPPILHVGGAVFRYHGGRAQPSVLAPTVHVSPAISPIVHVSPILHDGGAALAYHGGGGFRSYLKPDERPAILQLGEYVIRKRAVDFWGVETFAAMNRMHTGGDVQASGRSAPEQEDQPLAVHVHFHGPITYVGDGEFKERIRTLLVGVLTDLRRP